MECTVSNSMATVRWYKGEKMIEDGDRYEISKDLSGICRLTVKNCVLEDSGEYMCKIEKQEDKTVTQCTIIGKLSIFFLFYTRTNYCILSDMR